jgi:RNA polymerase sigma factor (sigma-70 family)
MEATTMPSAAPDNFKDAFTGNVLDSTGQNPGKPSKWLYYEKPVRKFIAGFVKSKGYRELEGLVEDLTQDVLIKIEADILKHYKEGSSGGFRPYLKQAIRNLLISKHREASRIRTSTDLGLATDDTSDEHDEPTEAFDAEVLRGFGRDQFDAFVKSEPPERQESAQMLAQWILDGSSQKDIAAAWSVTERHVRRCVNSAADRFAARLEKQVHPADWQALMREYDPSYLPKEVAPGGLRSLLRYVSGRKRWVLLAIIKKVVDTSRD